MLARPPPLRPRLRRGRNVPACGAQAPPVRGAGLVPLLALPDLPEVRVPQRLAGRQPVLRVVRQELGDELDAVRARVWDELLDPRALLVREVEVHVLGPPLELVQELGRGRAQHVVDLLYLVQLVRPGEEREQADDLEEHAPHPPHVHLVVVVPVRQQALRRPVPPRGDELRVRLFGVDPAAAPEVRQLEAVVHDEDVLRLDIPVEDSFSMHMV